MHCRKGRRNKFAETANCARHLSETKGCVAAAFVNKKWALYHTAPDRSTARPSASGPRKTRVRTHFRLKLPRPHSSRLVRSLSLLLREESHEQRRMSRGFGERVRRTKECKKRRLAVGMRVFILSSRITVTHFFNLWMYYYHFCLSSLFVRKQIAVVRALPAPPRRRCKCMCTLIQCILMHSPWALESCASQKLFSRCEQRTQFSAYNFGLCLLWFMSNMLCEQYAPALSVDKKNISYHWWMV